MIFLFSLLACHNDSTDIAKAHPTVKVDELYAKPAPVDPLVFEEGVPDEADLLPVQRRERRRMNLFQLDKALLDLTGYRYDSFWEARGPLGQPDYREIINEVREPELFFQKFRYTKVF